MFFDRLGNHITSEEPIVEEPVVESYYDPNRPVRPGFEKPQPIQEEVIEEFYIDETCDTYENRDSIEESVEDIVEYSEMDLDEMSDYISEYVITEAVEDTDRNEFRKYVKKLMFVPDSHRYKGNEHYKGNEYEEGSCEIILIKSKLKPEFHKYYDRIHDILLQYKESSKPMPTSIKHELFGLLGLSNNKWDIYINRSDISDTEIYLEIYKSTDTKNVFDKAGYRFFHQSNIPTLHQTGLKPSNASTHGRINANGEKTHNRVYNKPSCFFLAIRTTDLKEFYDYITKYQEDGDYGKYIYEYKPKRSDVFYQDLFNRKKHKKFGRILSVPVFINTDKNLPVTRVDKNIAALGAKQRRDDFKKRYDMHQHYDHKLKLAEIGVSQSKRELQETKKRLEKFKNDMATKPDEWFKNCEGVTPLEVSKLEEAKMSNDDKLYTKLRKQIEAKVYKHTSDSWKRWCLKRYKEAVDERDEINDELDKQTKNDLALLKRYKIFESFIDNEIDDIGVFLEQSLIEELCDEPFTEEEYQVFVEAKISAAERNELEDDDFGLVYEDEDGKKIRKYPLTDKQHVLQAVRFFGDCPDEYKPLLAHNILKRAKKFDIDDSNWDKIHEWNEKYSEDEDKVNESYYDDYIQEATSRSLKEVKKYQNQQNSKSFKNESTEIRKFLRKYFTEKSGKCELRIFKKDLRTDRERELYDIVCNDLGSCEDNTTLAKTKICNYLGIDKNMFELIQPGWDIRGSVNDRLINLTFKKIYGYERRMTYSGIHFIHLTKYRKLTSLKPSTRNTAVSRVYAEPCVFFFAVKASTIDEAIKKLLSSDDYIEIVPGSTSCAYEYIPRGNVEVFLDSGHMTNKQMKNADFKEVTPVFIKTRSPLPAKDVTSIYHKISAEFDNEE